MLTMKPQCNLVDAKKYFEEHLCVGDYYMEGQSVSGQWFGKGAEDLRLSGMTRAEDFLRLCDNLHPQTGERLTQRQNATRVDLDADGTSHKAANRRVFFDFTLSPPKPVSDQNFATGLICAGSSRISSSFLAQYTRSRFAPLTSLTMPCFSNCPMARITVL